MEMQYDTATSGNCQLLIKLNTHLPQDSVVSFQSIYLREMKTHAHGNLYAYAYHGFIHKYQRWKNSSKVFQLANGLKKNLCVVIQWNTTQQSE